MSAPTKSNLRQQKAREYWIYFIVTFPIFFVIALLSRLLPPSRRPFPKGRGAWVLGDAKAAAHTVLPVVFTH